MLKIKLLDDLTTEQEDNVLKEINYSREQLKLDLQLIKDWIKEQHHLPPSRLKEDDKFLISYLTGSKGSLETVKKKLDNYYTMRSYSEIFENRDPHFPRNIAAREFCNCATLPYAAVTGERLLIATYAIPDVDLFDHLSLVRYLINRLDVHIHHAGISSRVFFLVDFKGTPPSFVLKLSPILVRDVLFFMENAISLRIMKMVMINVPHFVEVALNKLLLPVMSKKLRERMQFCSEGFGDLHKYFSPKILPRDYGGESTNPSAREFNDTWSKYEDDNRSWYINEGIEQVDESKRIKTDNCLSNDTDSYFGVHGSLKKLIID